ncbi:MAG: DUF547 domain-containing protein [Calditrichaeota bacterium]|nr:DUF547 domain-containing protein [Calditrichota bacterium]MCB9369763.1 DUF547 domain-containing protein [Calditrichota bacterium]
MRKLILCLAVLICALPSFAFDHTYVQYQSVLDRFVKNGKVDYEGLLQDREDLDAFVASYADVPFERYQAFTQREKLAFLINLYNAAAMQLILNHWPLETIQDIGGLFSSPWNQKFFRLFDHNVSLGMVEHDILRADFKEPRIHFAIVCASKSCPILRSDAYVDSKLFDQLAEQEKSFLSERPEVNRFEDGVLYVSPIFKWFREDFDNEEGIRTLFQIYYPDVNNKTPIRYTEYDWSLNKQ